jgi:hypothetical protein
LNSSIISGSREVSQSRQELTADDPKMLRTPKWRPALVLTRRRKDRLEPLFEGPAGMDTPSTIMLCRAAPGIGLKVNRVSRFGDELRILQPFSEKPLPPRAHDPTTRLAVSHKDARNYSGPGLGNDQA